MNGGGGNVGGGDLHLPLQEHSHTVHCDQAHYGSASGGEVDTGATGIQEVVVTGQGGCGGDVDGGFGCRTDGGGGG